MTTFELLNLPTPEASEYPSRIEQLNLAAHQVQLQITDLADEAATHEENATIESASESNADKRKARRAELLRENEDYISLKGAVRDLELDKLRLTERSARLRREFQLIVAQAEASRF